MKANVYDEGRASHIPLRNGKPRPTRVSTKAGSARWLIAALFLLSALPLGAGARDLIQLVGGAKITPANARFFAVPWPVVLHIVGAFVYALLGAFQFSTRFRQRRPGWHRMAGRLLVVSGLMVGLSALWMNQFYPHPAGDGELLYIFRLVFGSAMIGSIVLGFAAIRRGKVRQHRAWMMRAYALGLGAGTQTVTLMVGEMIGGKPNELNRALLMGTAWVINLAVAEWAIRKRLNPRVAALTHSSENLRA